MNSTDCEGTRRRKHYHIPLYEITTTRPGVCCGAGEQGVSGGFPAGSGVAESADDDGGGFVFGVIGGTDRAVFGSFYLAASARTPGDQLRARFPAVVKIGTVSKMRDIVGSSLYPGVRITAASTPPPQIRILPGFTYFELDRNSPDWSDFRSAPALGVHIADEWPDLKLELWWVKRTTR